MITNIKEILKKDKNAVELGRKGGLKTALKGRVYFKNLQKLSNEAKKNKKLETKD